MLTETQRKLHVEIMTIFLEQGMHVSIALEDGVTDVIDMQTSELLFCADNGYLRETFEQWCHDNYQQYKIVPF
jgi:hypothetical protein